VDLSDALDFFGDPDQVDLSDTLDYFFDGLDLPD